MTPAGNRYGLPAFYSLHAWVWTENPWGMFNMWNPSLQCAGGPAAAHSDSESDSLLGTSARMPHVE